MTIYALISLATPNIAVADLGIHYEMTFEGVSDSKLLAEMNSISDTLALKDRPPPSLNLLHRRVERDRSRFLKLLKAWGYYGAKVMADIDSKAEPVRIVFRVDAGRPYLLKSVEFQIIGDPATQKIIRLPEAREIGLFLEKPFKTRGLIDAQNELLRRVRGQGFPFAKVTDRKVVVDHTDQKSAVSLTIDPGPQAQFGITAITGLTSVDEVFVRRKIPWREGDRFDADLLAEVQRRLTGVGLFATVRVLQGQTLDDKGRLPVTIAVKERKHRSISGGVSYKTDEGPGATISWEHRNVFHRGERLGVAASVSDITRAAEGGFRKPYFLRDDQSLRLSLRLAEDQPDAYVSRSLKSSALIERELNTQMKLGGGLALKTSEVDQLGDQESYGLFSIPLHFDWDTSDNFLNPTRGGRLAVQCAPAYNAMGPAFGFVKGHMSITRYLPLQQAPRLLVAGRMAFGAMGGTSFRSIPADERFYAGGGGSIRGYAYQSVGPLEGGVPIGGRSLLELSLELRLKLTENLGLVSFIDGGSAFESALPDLGDGVLWGSGLGIRYFTPIGPLRLDVGVPLNRRENIDDSFQVYVSLGQAF